MTLIAGCATWNPMDSLLKSEEAPAASESSQQTYYTAEAGMKLYPAPGFSSSPIAELPLHQKVYRTKVERGFAYVEVAGTGQKGWVDNGRLIWRLPTQRAAAPAPSDDKAPADVETNREAPAAAQEAPPVEAREAPPGPAEQVAEQPSADEPAAPAPKKDQESEGADPSLFSPF
jgi:hypothetical protein